VRQRKPSKNHNVSGHYPRENSYNLGCGVTCKSVWGIFFAKESLDVDVCFFTTF